MPRRPTVDCVQRSHRNRNTAPARVRKSHPYRRPITAAIVFALVPWITLGFGSALAFAFAAVFLRGLSRLASACLWVSAALYAAALGLFFATVDDAPDDSLTSTASTALIVMFVVAGIEAIALSPWVARTMRRSEASLDQGDVIAQMSAAERDKLEHDPAIEAAIEQRERRRLAREIVADDHALATTLRIGRPDLLRDFADGGLVDVNHVSDGVLASLPGLDAEMARRIVSARERFDGLRSPADLVVEAGIPSDVVDALSDVLVFIVDQP
jgi:DNA uptake protein ComE-like DNA-binding protein